ncbi:hypothetical protein CEXT_751851 [Caerostris extrusa]|uniref:Uncharacterized protein n=1 Tax=Caerostris extrusa TaxID=172846 RepID=A0AAV4RUV6_CAEEX|nr:hypothetical protein CEXT_751851 [Caerostris extrusa]
MKNKRKRNGVSQVLSKKQAKNEDKEEKQGTSDIKSGKEGRLRSCGSVGRAKINAYSYFNKSTDGQVARTLALAMMGLSLEKEQMVFGFKVFLR